MTKKKDMGSMTILYCPRCNEVVSGPDKKDVEATMARHMTKHPKGNKK